MERNGENVAIEVCNLLRQFGQKTAVDHLNLEIYHGEMFGLLGVNGAGKTTTIKMLCGLLRPTAGQIFVEEREVWANGENLAIVKKKMNLSPQETAVADNLTAEENLIMMAGLYGLNAGSARERAEEIIDELHLAEVATRRAKVLSGGWKRRLSIGMALVSEPQVLFLDEPTLGLDVLARRSLWETIGSLKQRMTIILTTHYLEEAEALCDRIGIMADGKLQALGTACELKALAGADSFEEAFVKLAAGSGKGEPQ